MSIHLRIEGLSGDSGDSGHQGWIDILDLKWGVRRRITSHTGTRGNRESSNAEITDLTLTKYLDSSSPSLFLESCCGRGKEMQLDLTKTGDGTGSDTYMSYWLKQAVVNSYHVEALALRRSRFVGNPRPVEIIKVSFVGLEARYTPYDDSGAFQAAMAVGFDAATNQRM
ncbi:MAG: type VI secretion system tube protein Hcp [Ectothiorhodospiraceae bacterium]|nr:type VI secretion system tube protein Hcp [Ectothiorhodospiraceae bacterium]